MPRLFVYSRKGKSTQLNFEGKDIAIGRSSENDVVINDPYSSNLHAYINPSDRGFVLKDNNSKNGTFLNSERIKGEVGLKKGDEILIGSTRIFFDKDLSTNVELTRGDSALTNIHSILPVKDVLKKSDVSTTIQEKAQEYRLLSVINAVSQELLLHRPKPELIDKIAEVINENFSMDRGALMLMDGNPRQLQPRSIWINNQALVNRRFQVSQNILNMVMNKNASLLISDVKDDTQLGKIESVIISKIHSAMCVPMWIDEEIIGVVYSDRISFPEPFSDEDLWLLTLIANLAAVKIEDCEAREIKRKADELKKQLDLAAQIQKNFLPRENPVFQGFDIAGHSIPTYQVGGDYYDFLPIGTNCLGVTIADVSGKGTPAALHMVALKTRLEVEAGLEYNIQEMTARLNDFVHRKTDTNRFISFFFCELDNLSGELRYVNAGHNPPIVSRRKGKTERLGSSGLCLGMFPSEQYDVGSVVLDRGDIAVLYTDGITESRNEDNKEFNERRFIKLVKENSECSAKELLDKIFKEIDLFTQVTEQMDDMTLVVIKREGRSVRP